jgi:Effector-associated domain 1
MPPYTGSAGVVAAAIVLALAPHGIAWLGLDLVGAALQPQAAWGATAIGLITLYVVRHTTYGLPRWSVIVPAIGALLAFCAGLPIFLHQGWRIAPFVVDLLVAVRVLAYLALFSLAALVWMKLQRPRVSGPIVTRPTSPTQIIQWIDDAPPFPWHRQEAQDLHRILVATHDRPDDIRNLIQRIGVPDRSKIAFDRAHGDIWTDLLDRSAAEGNLRKLLQGIADQGSPAGSDVAFIRTLL